MILWDLPLWFVVSGLFVLGAVVGSFLNVCIYRLPQHEPIRDAWAGMIDPPSSCPYCRQRIWAIDNLPLIGWLCLRGRCRFCRHRISVRYPAIELFNGLLFVGLYLAMVPAGWTATLEQSCIATPLSPLAAVVGGRTAVSAWLHFQYAYYLVLVETLLVASMIDFDLRIIPDSVTAPAMVVGVLGALTGKFYLLPVWYQDGRMLTTVWRVYVAESGRVPVWVSTDIPAWCAAWPLLHGLAVSVAGFVIGGGVVWAVAIAGRWVLRREAMGFGDVVLMAMIGTFLGWQATLIVFFLAPLFALAAVAAAAVMRLLTRSTVSVREIPYGPYLSLATVTVILGWKHVFPATSRFFELGPLFPVLVLLMAVFLVAVLWLVQGCKWLLGIPLTEPEWTEEWTSADQLAFFASKDRAAGSGPLVSASWPGVAAGQGLQATHRWQGRTR